MSRKTASVPSLNRRAEKRRRYREPVPATVFVLPDLRQVAAWVCDLSPAGVGLSLGGPVGGPGTRLLVRLPGPVRDTTQTALAEVVHSAGRGNGCWLVGCKFLVRLNAGQLHEASPLGAEHPPDT
jgi:hypothetical protein